MKRFTGHVEDEWGRFLDIKENAATVLRKELGRRKVEGTVLLGSVTDAYQPAEKKFGITRACLEVLAEYDVPISILTKSSLVLRDIDLLTRFSNCEVGLTVELQDDQLSAVFDPGASPISERVRALGRLHETGIRTYAFLGPIMPGLCDVHAVIDLVAGKIDYLMAESLNIGWENRPTILAIIEKHYPDLLPIYQKGFSKDYWRQAKQDVELACAGHNIPLKGFYDH